MTRREEGTVTPVCNQLWTALQHHHHSSWDCSYFVCRMLVVSTGSYNLKKPTRTPCSVQRNLRKTQSPDYEGLFAAGEVAASDAVAAQN